MNINKIGASVQPNLKAFQPVSFSAQEKTEDIPEQIEGKKRSLTAKKWGVGIASFALPGVGQIVNSEVGKGLAMLIPAVILGGITKVSKGGTQIISALATIGLAVYSIIDAVKNVKPDKE